MGLKQFDEPPGKMTTIFTREQMDWLDEKRRRKGVPKASMLRLMVEEAMEAERKR